MERGAERAHIQLFCFVGTSLGGALPQVLLRACYIVTAPFVENVCASAAAGLLLSQLPSMFATRHCATNATGPHASGSLRAPTLPLQTPRLAPYRLPESGLPRAAFPCKEFVKFPVSERSETASGPCNRSSVSPLERAHSQPGEPLPRSVR